MWKNVTFYFKKSFFLLNIFSKYMEKTCIICDYCGITSILNNIF